RPTLSTLFPYTTLFRSQFDEQVKYVFQGPSHLLILTSSEAIIGVPTAPPQTHPASPGGATADAANSHRDGRSQWQLMRLRLVKRSEEHTSELQSRGHLV